MIKIFYKNTVNRVICLLLTAIFLSSFPTGATALTFCQDAEKTHVVDQEHLHLADCHSSAKTVLPLFYGYRSTLADQESNDCIDISLSNSNSVIRPPEIILPGLAKVIFSVVLINSHQGFQKKIAGRMSSVLKQPQFSSPPINAQRTVVLLI